MGSKIIKAFWSNFFFKQCDKLDRDIDIFSSSKSVNKFFDIGFRMTDWVKMKFLNSRLRIFLTDFWREFSSQPVKLFSLFILAAVLTNLLLSLFFKEFDLVLVLIKMIVIALCLVGLKIELSLDRIKQNSIVSRLEKIYHDI